VIFVHYVSAVVFCMIGYYQNNLCVISVTDLDCSSTCLLCL